MRHPRAARADAIVLRRYDFGEADRLITLYTIQQGKVRAIAKGVRRITSRMAGHLDLLTYCSVLLVKGRNLDLITQGQTIEGFSGLRGDVWRTTYACYLAELVDRFSEDGVPNTALFSLLVRALRTLSTIDEEDLAVVVHAFELDLLSHVGYRPELRHCLNCRTAILPGINFFSAEAGGVFCGICGPDKSRSPSISVDALKVLRNLQTHPGALVGHVRIAPAVMAEVQGILDSYIQGLLERRPKSAAFIETMTRVVASDEWLEARHS